MYEGRRTAARASAADPAASSTMAKPHAQAEA